MSLSLWKTIDTVKGCFVSCYVQGEPHSATEGTFVPGGSLEILYLFGPRVEGSCLVLLNNKFENFLH